MQRQSIRLPGFATENFSLYFCLNTIRTVVYSIHNSFTTSIPNTYEQRPSVSRWVMGLIYGKTNWAKRFNKFWQLSLQQFNTRGSLYCSRNSHFWNKCGNPSQPKPRSQSRHWISILGECRMKIWPWMRAGGKAVGWEINSIPVIIFFQGQQGAQLEPLETSLIFPASFAFARNGSQVQSHTMNKFAKIFEDVGICFFFLFFIIPTLCHKFYLNIM